MPRVNLPAGCGGFTSADGSRYDAKPGTSVELSDVQAARLAKSQHASIGMITLNPGTRLATKGGRRCVPCHFLAQSWSVVCPRCGKDTEEES